MLQKAFSFLLLAALTLAVCIPVSASNSTTTLTTEVPSHFTIDVSITGKGSVSINGTNTHLSQKIQIERNKEIMIYITADDGYTLENITYNGIDVTKYVEDNCLQLPMPDEDSTLMVSFAAVSDSPSTGDERIHHLLFLSITAILSLTGIIVLLSSRRKWYG